jgi:hypothetical protein
MVALYSHIAPSSLLLAAHQGLLRLTASQHEVCSLVAPLLPMFNITSMMGCSSHWAGQNEVSAHTDIDRATQQLIVVDMARFTIEKRCKWWLHTVAQKVVDRHDAARLHDTSMSS